ncbi:MAG: twitching motility protein PilT, partial [Bacteroidetes bacterium]
MNLSFLSEMQVTLSEYITGKQRFQNINKMIMFNSAWKEEAFECLRDLLIHMREIKASDIDIGGPGSKNKIWFRVYGIKKPSDDLPSFKQDEITAILLSILTDDQKVMLFNNKNVDISLGLVLKKGERPNRFRGDIYYESNTLAANFRRVNQEIFSMEQLDFP